MATVACGSGRARERADMAAFQNKINEGPNNMLRESIRNKINRKNYNIIFGRLEGSRNTKRGFWACFSEEYKKR
jgi:hypothetical protein